MFEFRDQISIPLDGTHCLLLSFAGNYSTSAMSSFNVRCPLPAPVHTPATQSSLSTYLSRAQMLKLLTSWRLRIQLLYVSRVAFNIIRMLARLSLLFRMARKDFWRASRWWRKLCGGYLKTLALNRMPSRERRGIWRERST